MIKTINSMLAVLILFGIGAVITCSQAADKRAQAEADCSKLATDKTGYNPANPPATSSNIGKGAAIGAAGGAVVGAISSNKSKKVVQGAVIGGAAGAGIGAIQDNEKKKAAAQSRDAYQREYQNCLKDKGF